ncbi:alpha-ketoglutarate permease [Ditylenchus destructor]|uniref:Alpha-ketoglutarate permease n=1 Tax=Ditylenchus destructor TaxID=166010 RepID=A0AAD4MGF1_9BILA|nr:alpha-ketoglutarate permease [Ditylenchus destructor]
MLGALVIVTGYTSINAVVKAELFPAHIRTLGVALPYALANAIFGGTAEYVALWFKDQGMERGFYWYVTGMIGISLIVYLRMRDTRRTARSWRIDAMRPRLGHPRVALIVARIPTTS